VGKLLPDTPDVRYATASGELNALLDQIEGDFLAWKKFERKLVQGANTTHSGIIDISSATSMNIFPEAGKDVLLPAEDVRQTVTAYPYVIPKEHSLENAFSVFLKDSLGIEAGTETILVTNGTYAATRTLVRAFPGDVVLVPEFMNQAQKVSIVAMGKEVQEIPMLTPGWLLDLNALEKLLRVHQGRIACVYIHHLMSADLTADYLEDVGELLESAGVVPIIDSDILKTVHTDVYPPTLPLNIASLATRGLFLFTLSKEFGAPGVRLGFAVGPQEHVEHVRVFMQRSLEMVPPTSRLVAREILAQYDLTCATHIFHDRMNALVAGLQSLGLEASSPNIGINLFMHVPRGWEKTTQVLPDHLFTYYCLTRAGVVLRPGSIYGHRLNHFVRFVVGQPVQVIKKMIERLQLAGVRGDMPLPEGLEEEYQEMMRAYRTQAA